MNMAKIYYNERCYKKSESYAEKALIDYEPIIFSKIKT
jgi:hypothetical protein